MVTPATRVGPHMLVPPRIPWYLPQPQLDETDLKWGPSFSPRGPFHQPPRLRGLGADTV